MQPSDYDRALSDCKHAVTQLICRAISDLHQHDEKGALDQLASGVDNLNGAWDALTDALVRQRDERDHQIRRLINELAERRK